MRPSPSLGELGPAIDGRRRSWRPDGCGGVDVCYYVAEKRRGRPLVFVHDLRLTSSAYEMRPLFEAFRWRRPTFAIDLPGFGLSNRLEVPCSRALLASVLGELCRKLRKAEFAVDVVALGRGAAPAAMVARDHPELLRSLVMVEPSGLLSTRGGAIERLAVKVAISLGDRAASGLFSLMATRPMVSRALRARFHGAPDAGLVDYSHATAQVKTARRLPFEALNHVGVASQAPPLFHDLTLPVLVVHDAHGAQTVQLEAFLRGRTNRFAVRVSPTRGMPQFERRIDTFEALDRFWQSLPRAAWDEAIR